LPLIRFNFLRLDLLPRPAFLEGVQKTLCAVSGVDQTGKSCYCDRRMSSRVDSAIPTRLCSIRKELIGKKLRVVGKYVPKSSPTYPSRSSRISHHLFFTHPPFLPPQLYPRVLSHDVRSSTVLLWNDGHIVLADISLCLPTRGSSPWLREPRSTVTMLGYLERRSQVTSFFFYLPGVSPTRTHGVGGKAGRNHAPAGP